jgi:hypothetical protein
VICPDPPVCCFPPELQMAAPQLVECPVSNGGTTIRCSKLNRSAGRGCPRARPPACLWACAVTSAHAPLHARPHSNCQLKPNAGRLPCPAVQSAGGAGG